MFSDHKDNQTQTNTDVDDVAKDISETSPAVGIGNNPTPFSPVLPSQAATTPLPPPSSDNTTTPDDTSSPDLEDIKLKALAQLSPLVGKLNQPPEERYKTLMMLIQASDNHELIKDAYTAANEITDEALKAEALLGIVNEINYFNQKTNS